MESAADDLRSLAVDDAATLREAFEEAVEHINTTRTAIDSPTQRRLFGLFHRAANTNLDPLEAEQRAEVKAVEGYTRAEAMRAYVELVAAADENAFLFEEEEPKEETEQELPPEILAQLEANGMVPARTNEQPTEQLPPDLLARLEAN